MNKKQKPGINYIMFISIIAVIIFTVFRICTDTTQNTAFGISGRADDKVRMADAYCIELEYDTPVAGLTGFSFQFTGDRNYFGDKAFLVTAAVQNDASDTQALYEGEMKLSGQAFDCYNECYKVIIPFDGDIQQGDHLCITILGMGMSEEDNISVQISSLASVEDAVFAINDSRRDGMLASTFYYQIRKLDVFPKLMQGIVFILLIVLAGELLVNVRVKDKNQMNSANINQIPVKKKIVKLSSVMVLLVVLLDYACYAGAKRQIQDYDLPLKLSLLFIVFSVLVAGMTLVVFWCGQSGMKLEKLFFLAIVCLGILFEIVITPFAVPDEASHIDTAYRISNEILGIEDTEIRDAIYKRECDIYPDSGVKRTISEDTYKWLYNDWFSTERRTDETLIYAGDNRGNANSLFFLPAAVGITIGRILGIGFLPMIYLARTINLLLAAWMIYLAVQKIPYGKSILCMIALLPITLQEIASCSYDALIIAISLLYVGYCIFAIYSKTMLEKVDILIILVTAVMLAICKGGVYTPLYLLGLWILVKRGYIRFPREKGTRIAGVAAVAFMVFAGIAVVIYLYRLPVSTNPNSFYSLPYLIQHPWKTFRVAENSLYRDTYYYVEQLFGKAIGCFQISVKFIVPIGYMILLGRSVICSERYPYIPDVLDKCVFMITAALVFAAVQVAFLFSATVIGQYSIGGVQGRYFLPMIWLFLICFRRKNVVYKNKNYTGFVLTAYLLGICSVLQIAISAFNPNA